MVMESSLDSHPSYCEQTVMHSRVRMQNDRTQGPTAKAVPARAPYTFEDRVVVVCRAASRQSVKRAPRGEAIKRHEADRIRYTFPDPSQERRNVGACGGNHPVL